MTYEYYCPSCKNIFDVIKSAKDMERNETCNECGDFGERKFVPSRVFFSKTSVQHAEYNPGLGCVTNNSQHRAEIAKRKGLEEIGNENPDKIANKFEKDREERRERNWADADKGWVGDGSS